MYTFIHIYIHTCVYININIVILSILMALPKLLPDPALLPFSTPSISCSQFLIHQAQFVLWYIYSWTCGYRSTSNLSGAKALKRTLSLSWQLSVIDSPSARGGTSCPPPAPCWALSGLSSHGPCECLSEVALLVATHCL